MKVFVGLVSSKSWACEKYEEHKNKLIPKEALLNTQIRKLNPLFVFGAFNPYKNQGKLSLETYLIKATRGMDGVVLLIDKEQGDLSPILYSAYFTTVIELYEYNTNFNNFFHNKLTRLLKNYALIMELMRCADNEKVMILPLRNFIAKELTQLTGVCRNQAMNANIGAEVGPLIYELKMRRRPRKKSSYSTLYYVDDCDKHFHFGDEKHSRIPTGPPHGELCEIAGNFRFGKRIANDRHFNVVHRYDNHSLSGIFPNCHDESVQVVNRTHLNMFSNDYHG